jgi:hypothetical protein
MKIAKLLILCILSTIGLIVFCIFMVELIIPSIGRNILKNSILSEFILMNLLCLSYIIFCIWYFLVRKMLSLRTKCFRWAVSILSGIAVWFIAICLLSEIIISLRK